MGCLLQHSAAARGESCLVGSLLVASEAASLWVRSSCAEAEAQGQAGSSASARLSPELLGHNPSTKACTLPANKLEGVPSFASLPVACRSPSCAKTHKQASFFFFFSPPCGANLFRNDGTCFQCSGFSTKALVLMIPTAKSMKSSFTAKNLALHK